MVGPEREQLVGLKAAGPMAMTAGAHLFTPGDRVHRETIRAMSPRSAIRRRWAHLGLAFLKNGRARHGRTVRVVDHLRKIDVLCEVTDPVFHDKEGVKLRA
jgi:methylglutamate dehydrogenase subunit C